MGILYIRKYFALQGFLHKITLSNSWLVIDGDVICKEIYADNCDYEFGGEYSDYAVCVSNFFDNLLKYHVKPMVIFHGGFANKNFDKIHERVQDEILKIPNLHSDKTIKIQPLLLMEVFKSIARAKDIQCYHTLLDARGEIALIARVLECPVLSSHSDFYIYGSEYISYNSVKRLGNKNPLGKNVRKIYCEMTKFDYILQKFPNMDRSALPFVEILLGKHNSASALSEKFIATSISAEKSTDECFTKCPETLKVHMIFKWLSKHTLDTAVFAYTQAFDAVERQSVIETIEKIINKYATLSFTVFDTLFGKLNYSPDEINIMIRRLQRKPYQFLDFNALKVAGERKGDCKNKTSEEVLKDSNVNAPTWFIDEYKNAKLPAYFIDILFDKTYICRTQLEDFSHSSCINVSLRIIRVTFKLLSTGTTNAKTLKYIARGEGTEFKTYELECDLDLNLPSLQSLNKLTSKESGQILLNTLGVSDDFLQGFPPAWRLYVGTVKYWLNEADKAFVTKHHVYTLIFMMVYQVIKKVKFVNYKTPCSPSKCIVQDAVKKVDKEDCRKAESLFESYSEKKTDAEIDMTVIHAFESLKKALKHSMDLNALLGNPYPNVDVANFFSGIMMYNLYKALKTHEDVDIYVKTVFQKTPTIFHLFCSISDRIYTKLPDA